MGPLGGNRYSGTKPVLTTMKFLSSSFRRHDYSNDYSSLFSRLLTVPSNVTNEPFQGRKDRCLSSRKNSFYDNSSLFKLAFDGSIKVCTIMMDRYGPYRFDTSILRIHTPARLRALLHSSFLAEYRVTKTLFDNGDLRARESRTNERQVW